MIAAGAVLVVDDHVDLADNIAEILRGIGRDAVTADSAEAALDLVIAGGIGVLLTDYRLPGWSGAQLIAELFRRGLGLPAVVMSAYTDDETIATARGAGAVDVFAKPVEIGRLLALVQTLGSA
jgi:DNA-binding NtrC family response regulator